jgi:hypothetical protein
LEREFIDISVDDLGLIGYIFTGLILDGVVESFRIPRLTLTLSGCMDNSWRVDLGIDSDGSVEVTSCFVEFVLYYIALSHLDVRSGDNLDFLGMEGSIWVVETFGSFTSSGSDVIISLELPIGP